MSEAVRTAMRAQHGVALLMVLWIFMVLTVLVAEFSRTMRDDAVAAQNLGEELQARGVAVAAMNQAIYRHLRAREQPAAVQAAAAGSAAGRPATGSRGVRGDGSLGDDGEEMEVWAPDGTWHEGEYGGGAFSLRMADEGGKISLNRADPALFRRIFTNLGLDGDQVDGIVDSILDWRDSDNNHRLHGAEADYYLHLPQPYTPKNGPFDSVDELLLVRGIGRDLFYGVGVVHRRHETEARERVALKDVFSVFNRTANINVRHAPAAVLEVLMGGDEKDVEDIVAARDADPEGVIALLRAKIDDQTVARRLVDSADATTLAIDARATMQGGHIEARVGAVVDLVENSDGFHIARWIDSLPAL